MSGNEKNLVIETFPVGGYAVNCSIIYSHETKEAIIIDPGFDHKAVLKKIDTLKVIVKKLVHTHAHFDHIGESNKVKAQTGAKIYLHKEDEPIYLQMPMHGILFGQSIEAPGPIDHYLKDGEEFGFEDPDIGNFLKTIHTPGHSPGSCCFYSNYFSTPLLFSGDTLFQNSIGRTDLPGGDSRKIIKSIKERLFILPDETTVIPGHGPNTTIYDEKKFNPFLS